MHVAEESVDRLDRLRSSRGQACPVVTDAGLADKGAVGLPADDPVAGRRPPVPAWAPLAWFSALASVLLFVVVALVRPPGLLDDPDPAYQRDGLLLDGPVVAQNVSGVDFGGRPVVLLFVRDLPTPDALAAWTADISAGAETHVVVPEQKAGAPALGENVVVDPGRLAEAVDMREPVDQGTPVGYAVVDSSRVVRYATLDPAYLKNAFEVAVIAGAVR